MDIREVKNGVKEKKRTAGYFVSQYMSSQKSSFIRTSQAWRWTFRGYRKA